MKNLQMQDRLIHRIGTDTSEESGGEIRNIQQMWDATIQYFEEDFYDTEAMYKVYKRMSAKMNFQDIADVFSGVYADTYWNITFMDPSLLSKSLQSALAIGAGSADEFATSAMRTWRGIFCRNNISDYGSIPESSNYTQSLDIVCNQDTGVPSQALIENWNQTYWDTPKVGKNYVYTRCQNLAFLGPITPVSTMFFTNGGFNQPPTSWQQLFTVQDQAREGEVILLDGKAGPMDLTVRGVSEAFSLEPKSTEHICVIGIMATKYFTKNDPRAIPSGNWDSNRWIRYNGGAAWHNVNPQINVEDSLSFYNQDGSQEDFVFSAQCRNLPVGSVVRLRTEDQDSSSNEFDTGFQTISNPNQVIHLHASVPGYYEGRLLVHLEGPDGNLLPSSAAVEVKMNWKLASNHNHYHDALSVMNKPTAHNNIRSNKGVKLNLGTYTIEGVS